MIFDSVMLMAGGTRDVAWSLNLGDARIASRSYTACAKLVGSEWWLLFDCWPFDGTNQRSIRVGDYRVLEGIFESAEISPGTKLVFHTASRASIEHQRQHIANQGTGPIYMMNIGVNNQGILSTIIGNGDFFVEVCMNDLRYNTFQDRWKRQQKMGGFEVSLRNGLDCWDSLGFGEALRGILTGESDQSPKEVVVRYGSDLERLQDQAGKLRHELKGLFLVPTSEMSVEGAIAALSRSNTIMDELRAIDELIEKERYRLNPELASKMSEWQEVLSGPEWRAAMERPIRMMPIRMMPAYSYWDWEGHNEKSGDI